MIESKNTILKKSFLTSQQIYKFTIMQTAVYWGLIDKNMSWAAARQVGLCMQRQEEGVGSCPWPAQVREAVFSYM